MPPRFVAVPAEALRARFHEAGFTEDVYGREVVFRRAHSRCEHVVVTVYSSIPATGDEVRKVGEDAIRVTAVFSRQTPGRDRPFVRVIAKTARVYRTGTVEGVLQRAIERAREAYAAGSEFLRSERCFECEKREKS